MSEPAEGRTKAAAVTAVFSQPPVQSDGGCKGRPEAV